MKNILLIILAIAICFVLQWFVPVWWVFAPFTLLFAYFIKYPSAGLSFLFGLITVFVTWMLLYLIKDSANEGLLSQKMATLFTFKSSNWLFIIVSLVMGLIGGFTSVAGYLLRKK